MAGEATVTFKGNLGNDPEHKITPSGKSVCSFSVAVTPRVKKDDEWTDGDTTWYRVTLWGRDADTAVDALSKGTTVVVSGSYSQREYVDKNQEKRVSNEVRAELWGVVPKLAGAPSGKAATESDDDFPW